MKILKTSLFFLLLKTTHLYAWPGMEERSSEIRPQAVVSGIKDKLSSIREERPEAIAELERRVRQDGEAYYESLGNKISTVPCGTSRGYILSDGLSLISGLQKIVLSEVPAEKQAQAAVAMGKYQKMMQKIREDADPSFLSGEGASFLNFLSRFGEVLWDGKIIRKTSNPDKYSLHNKIFSSNSGIEKFQAEVYYLDSSQSTINIDYAPSHYQLIRNIRDEIRQVDENLYVGKAFYKGTHSSTERLILYFALDFSESPLCEIQEERTAKNWELPDSYLELSACDKRDTLWEKVVSSRYDNLPSFDEVDALGLLSQTLTGTLAKKMDYSSDVSPEGWNKPIHSQGSMAQVKLETPEDVIHPYTGLFSQSSPCALMRLSLTGNPHQKSLMGMGKERGVAPGLALKLFVDGQASQDISLLTSLSGQGSNMNFFAHEFSNQVAPVQTPEMMAVHQAFKTVSTYPERLSVAGASEWLPDGSSVLAPLAPSKIVFVPVWSMEQQSDEDMRTQFHTIPVGTTLFRVFAQVDMHYDGEENVGQRHYIGKIVTVSPFISSRFGDEKIFFKHRRFEQDFSRKSP